MIQQGQVFELKRRGRDGEPRWAYRYRAGGRGSRRIQRGGFASERDALDALEREFNRLRREQRIPRSLTLAELVDVYLAQHDVQPVTIEKLRWLLGKAIAVFGDRRIGEVISDGPTELSVVADLPALCRRGEVAVGDVPAPPNQARTRDLRRDGPLRGSRRERPWATDRCIRAVSRMRAASRPHR